MGRGTQIITSSTTGRNLTMATGTTTGISGRSINNGGRHHWSATTNKHTNHQTPIHAPDAMPRSVLPQAQIKSQQNKNTIYDKENKHTQED
jgi:hypothetical protein